MSIILKVSGGLLAGAFAGALAVAFWPHIDPRAVAAKAAVEQPVFVNPQASVATPAPAPASAVAAAPALDKEAVAMLSQALTVARPAMATRGIELTLVANAQPASEEARRLCAEGLVALAGGDIAAARSFLEKAAEGGDARALMVLGDTYDPATLVRLGAIGLKGDEQTARGYYSRALAAGVGAARERMASLTVQ